MLSNFFFMVAYFPSLAMQMKRAALYSLHEDFNALLFLAAVSTVRGTSVAGRVGIMVAAMALQCVR